ncbi:conserved Plasmodium protein, unknown function [Plasmodium knowlesi strain H]|uniref:Uncharacterized protein n=3 Tax=Plasmodium knowlesi TaxID=5850 RepID=A0A5K1VUZ4_PLAKH|nr:conserved Plasmodium protein, unknown function [Plasmodium knowlesi strain H]OTN67024.1 Uncharacterized protein PKNOH_S07459800 [Plasmodium knowlesi]CAA9988723.1 conserved Plasmodium protein, unknown function [Plasmodium knowlesi strain H]SBO21673.1 conserved Plasmodium protein, unknown function [Plasmodium knowlesi strain H]SBO22032.1 conserved Plasmodium protein, unknown function [Plasmodium knowlesi strain H]VVS78197.1 conserved Plasmodium protein, unknown function [Plasmodium knowlesi s|eukprot:XP_002259698.1 hypothetical protein, conserved in Plasmodium species [Plasmodium knowlesi strain H]
MIRTWRLLLLGRGRMYSTLTCRRDKLDSLRMLSYDFYRRSQGKKGVPAKLQGEMAQGAATLSELPPDGLSPGERLYLEAVTVSHSVEEMFREDIYNSQSYVLILKGLVNTLTHVKEEGKRRHLRKLITTFVGFFQRYVHLMNEQDITLLLDVTAKCSIRKKEINQLIIQRLSKGEKNTLFFSLNSKSVCIILNSLHKVIPQGNHAERHADQYARAARRLTSDIFHFYVVNRYKNFSLGQMIIILHSMHRYGYEKCRVAGLIGHIAQRLLETCQGGEATSNLGNAIKGGCTEKRNNTDNSVEHEGDPPCDYKPDQHTRGRSGPSTTALFPSRTDDRASIFDLQNKYELILLHTLSCYNYCNNHLLGILLCEVKRKLFTTYKEKEVCMFLSAMSNYLAIPTSKRFEVYVTDEESNINENNQVYGSELVRTFLIKEKKRLSNYTKFSIATIYIILSKLNFFYENKDADAFFLDKLFLEKYFPKKKKKKIFFSVEEDNITVKTIISLLFSLVLNGQRDITYYGALFDSLILQMWDGTVEASTEESHDVNKGTRALKLLSVQNAHMLCVVYTYLHLHNMLAQLKRTNLHFFRFLLSNFNYMNCTHLKQHVSSQIHAEINAIIGLIKTKKKKKFVLTNECFVFPYYVDICLGRPWA